MGIAVSVIIKLIFITVLKVAPSFDLVKTQNINWT